MVEYLVSRAKVSLLLVLFVAPVAASIWDKRLDAWLAQNHRLESPVATPIIPADSVVSVN